MIKVDNKQDLMAELGKSKRVLALFYATWCPYCMRFISFFEDQVASQHIKNVVHVILDDYDNPLWDEYDIAAVPTAILFEDGEVSSRLDGRLGRGLKEDLFLEWLKEHKPS